MRRLVEMHGGSITAASDGRGLGSRFALVLPVTEERVVDAGASNGKRASGRGNGAASTAALTGEPHVPAAPSRILLVEDNADAADSLAMLLELRGHTVKTCTDGPQAIESFGAFAPEVVLMDIGLPGMDGHEAVRIVRRMSSVKGVLLIALSGYGLPGDIDLSLAAGFDHHLVKPVDVGRILEKIEEHQRGGMRPDLAAR